MKKMIVVMLVVLCTLSVVGCNTQESANNPAVVPEDFAFALARNCFGISSYDSQTGKLVKTTDAVNPDDFVTYYELSDQDKAYIYNLIAPLDIHSYPDVYDPQNGMSKPSMTLILTVYCNGTQKNDQSRKYFAFFCVGGRKKTGISICTRGNFQSANSNRGMERITCLRKSLRVTNHQINI